MKKGGFLRNVLDTIRSNQATGQSGRGGSTGNNNDRSFEYGGQLKPSHFSLAQVARHGFPEHPTALAFDPVQKIAAIGTRSGAIRIFGRPGVDVWAQHEPAFAVTHIKFIVNQGAIITVTSDESIHLWSLRGPNLKLQLSGATSSSPQTAGSSVSPAPTSNISSVKHHSGISSTSATGTSTTASPGSLLGSITDTVSEAVDSASDFLGGGGTSASPQTTSSPAGEFNTNNRQITPKQPERLHTLKFQREHITFLHQTLLSKWLYIGTERGNIHVANVETFELSGYSIAWNKAIELSRKTHPGAIIHISECPQDSNKLLIGYESGCIVLWDLKQKNPDGRYYQTDNLLWLAWHHEGKQFMAAHGDGSLITWQIRSNTRPINIHYPHSKSGPTGSGPDPLGGGGGGQQQAMLASSLVRSLNNELYRPINKVEWKISKSNEQFLLFSGGLPYDGLDQQAQGQDPNSLNKPPSRQSAGLSPARFATAQAQQQQQQQLLKASSASPSAISGHSPLSPSISPGGAQQESSGQKCSSTFGAHQQQRQLSKKILRSTSLTVMLGKSITVLEMDDTIIDFITICDNSPYENDTSDPYAMIVLLSKELILIDLTSSGYPSFESPYPSTNLNESPVTCVQYLADCSSDLIPFLYSNSQNAVSRAPKKGFSDKDWPINGGEWGQSLQSYPELVLTGHADGTIKFWDMSGINFDLISKIKTSKLFQRPNLPPNATFVVPANISTTNGRLPAKRGSQQQNPLRPSSPSRSNISLEHDHHHQQQQQPSSVADQVASGSGTLADQTNQTSFIENLFAIEKIEFCSNTKHLLVAGAYSQIIQFKLNKKESHSSSGASGSSGADLTTILVEPMTISSTNNNNNNNDQRVAATPKQHLLFRTKDNHQGPPATSSSSGGSSSSASSHRSRFSGFLPELICLTPLLMSNEPPESDYSILGSTTTTTTDPSSTGPTSIVHYCRVPPKITALALQETHNILAYAHENGIVLVDIIQKCVIMQATISDLYGISNAISNNRDISIQPFATSAILQQHYQSTASSIQSPSPQATGSESGYNTNNADNSITGKLFNGDRADTSSTSMSNYNNNGTGNSAGSSTETNQFASPSNNPSTRQQPQIQSRYTTNSMFQRQLSTNALNSPPPSNTNANNSSSNNSNTTSGGAPVRNVAGRGFQRQMTASQLLGSGSSFSTPTHPPVPLSSVGQNPTSGSGNQQHLDNKQKAAALLAGVRGIDPSVTSSTACLLSSAAAATAASRQATETLPSSATKKPAKNKRIISRMLSISAIHTSVGGGGGGTGSGSSNNNNSSDTAPCTDDTTNSAAAAAASPPRQLADDSGSGDHRFPHHHHHHQATSAADKFDSSFTRSRSSSSSSTTGIQQANELGAGHLSSGSNCESIQCIAFLDPTSATAPPTSVNGGSLVQSSAGGGSQNHKSLSSMDCNPHLAPPHLALWLGTSTGSVLLVNLAMPDNEDNRVLQLQSINAEPIPQASIKLPGQILCLMPFFCEARPTTTAPSSSSTATAATSSSTTTATPPAMGSQLQHQFGSQTSSMDCGDANANPHSPASGSGLSSATSGGMGSISGTTGHLTSDHHHLASSGGVNAAAVAANSSSGHSSFDSPGQRNSGLFLAIVSEKQAHIYQVPANCNMQTPPTSANAPNSQLSSADQTHSLHHQSSSVATPTTSSPGGAADPLHHQHSAGSASGASEWPLSKLLINKANQVAKCDISDTSFACRSGLVQMRTPDECCLVSYLATGNLVVHSLPRLRPVLMDTDFVPYTSPRLAQSMLLSRQGHCLYQPCSGEICKFTISSQYKSLVNEMLGSTWVAREMPEMPRPNFFKSLFSASQAAKQTDRDELFGECAAGKPSRGVAKHIGAGSEALERLKGAAIGTMGHDLRVAREGLDERGEKLGEIEDKTLQMMNQSESYAQAAHKLAERMKDKKWYQF